VPGAGDKRVTKPEEQAREEIDRLLGAAGWAVQDLKSANIQAARGVALREFQLKEGYGAAEPIRYFVCEA
jgi:type I restriction enzyme R subunit